MFVVYVLKSIKAPRTYVGYTKDITQRLKQHNNGLVSATKHFCPWAILFTENLHSKIEAKKRELYWKSGAGRRKLKIYFSNHSNSPAS